MSWEPRPDGSVHARQLGPNCFWWHPSLPNAARGLPDAHKMVVQPRYTAPQVDVLVSHSVEELNFILQDTLKRPGRVLISLDHVQAHQGNVGGIWFSVSVIYQDELRLPEPAPEPDDVVLPVPH